MSEQGTADRVRHLRPLLPAVGRRESPSTSTPSTSQSSRVAACVACHKRKSKCSGERPTCVRCARRRIPCQYIAEEGETNLQALKRSNDKLRDRLKANEELFGLLRNLPDKETQDVLTKIKSGTDPAAILSHVRTGNLLLQMRVVPETRFRYDFPYLSEMPRDLVPNNPYLNSLLHEATFLYSSDQLVNFSQPEASKLPPNLEADGYRNIYLKPFHAAEVIDPLLTDVEVSWWTYVCEDNTLMQDLLSVFFRCEYQFTAAFQKDYFLQDMAAQRNDFCSSLLINAVLAYACVCYPSFLNRAEYWNPHTLHYRFLAEAKRLWELEAENPRITTIQAGIIFNVIHNLSGLDELGQVYLSRAIDLAHQIKLFENPVEEPNVTIRNGRVFTAWAVYNWQALVAFSFMTCPKLKEPPDFPLPDPSENIQWYAEIWVRYPMTQTLVPSYFGQIFRARCYFRVIMNDFSYRAYSSESGISLNQANEFSSRLEDWFNSLPEVLNPKSIVLPGHLQLHIYYYYLLLTIYQRILDFSSKEDAFVQRVIDDATKYIQTLVRLYYLRHGFESMDLFIVVPLMHIAYECLDTIDEETPIGRLDIMRSTLFLAMKGLYSQCQNHYLAKALFRVIRGRMSPREVSIMQETMDPTAEEEAGRVEMEQAVRSRWPVSVVKNKDKRDRHILKNLVDDYARLNVSR